MNENNRVKNHPVVSHEEWLAARTAFLVKEKEFTRLRDELSEQRRNLPWEEVTKNYVFEGADGKQTLAELFEGRSQLIVYHFMFGPDWEAGCPHCSFWADNFNPIIVHLNQRDTTMIAVSRAPYDKLVAYRKRMGWSFKWVSSFGTDFNFDFQASFAAEDLKKGRVFYNFRQSGATKLRARRGQRALPGYHRHDLSHLFDLCPRHRPDEHGLQLPGSHAQGPR